MELTDCLTNTSSTKSEEDTLLVMNVSDTEKSKSEHAVIVFAAIVVSSGLG